MADLKSGKQLYTVKTQFTSYSFRLFFRVEEALEKDSAGTAMLLLARLHFLARLNSPHFVHSKINCRLPFYVDFDF